jgi:hypothetical protein
VSEALDLLATLVQAFGDPGPPRPTRAPRRSEHPLRQVTPASTGDALGQAWSGPGFPYSSILGVDRLALRAPPQTKAPDTGQIVEGFRIGPPASGPRFRIAEAGIRFSSSLVFVVRCVLGPGGLR